MTESNPTMTVIQTRISSPPPADTHVFLPDDAFVGWELAGAVTPERCAELVEMLVARGFEPTGARYPGDYRNNDRLVFDDAALADWLFERTRERLPAELVIDGERWLLEGLNRRFRACRYAGGQAFCIHRDGPYAPDAALRSHLTLQLYLDADPARAGGHTRFYADPRGDTRWASIEPRTGTAIVFDHRAWHDGEAVTNGVKHVLRTDVIYRRVAAVTRAAPTSHVDDRVLHRHRGYAWQAIVCRDGTIASAGRDGTVRIRRERASSRAWRSRGAGIAIHLGTAPDVREHAGAALDARECLGSASAPGASPVVDANAHVGVVVDADAHVGAVVYADAHVGAVVDADAHVGAIVEANAQAVSASATIDLGAGSVTRLVEAHDGRLWCGTRAGSIFVIEGLRATAVAHELGAILDLAARPGGGIVAATSFGELVALERNGTIAWRTCAHDGWAWSVMADATGYLSSGHAGQIVAVDETGNATEIARLDAPLRALAIAGNELWVGDTHGVLHRVGRDGRVHTSWSAHRGAITGIAVRRDGHVMTSAEDGCVRVWAASTCISALNASDFVTSVAEDRDGRIVCASYDGAIYRAPLTLLDATALARSAEPVTSV
jgi:hypothetical protein